MNDRRSLPSIRIGWLAGVFLAAWLPLSVAGGEEAAAPAASVPCAPDNGGISLPPGFCATVFADGIGHVRNIAVSPQGVVYANTWSGRYFENDTPHAGGFLVALRDTTGDGVADEVVRFGDSVETGGTGGTGIAFHDDAVYAEANDRILRYALTAGSIAPRGAPQVIVDQLPMTGDHPMHPFVIDRNGSIFMDSGSPSNSCQVENRTLESRGKRPCKEIETRAGVWRYDAKRTDQHFSAAERFASGIRNADGLAVDGTGLGIYATQHGRDQLSQNWPKLYTPEQGANLPAEELLRVEPADYGWPECYFDNDQRKLVLAPEYGGNGGKAVGLCAKKRGPIAFYPAHWAPNALVFYLGEQFPAKYRGGVFIAFHGSWNRAPFAQQGYNVVFQPFEDGKPTQSYEVFADGFAGAVKEPGSATHRPAGVAVGPDGALYISDDQRGTIWRVVYDASNPTRQAVQPPPVAPSTTSSGAAQPPEGTHPDAGANPAGVAPSLPPLPADAAAVGITADLIAAGSRIYHDTTCSGCHGSAGKGTPQGANLATTRFLWGDGSYGSMVKIITDGVPAPKEHIGVMPARGGAQLTDEQVRAVAAYVYALSRAGAKP